MKKLSRRQAVALAAATMAVGMTATKPAVATLDYSHCLPSRFTNLQDLLVDAIRHTKRTGDRIIEANDPGRMVFGWVAIPWDNPQGTTKRWEIPLNRIIRTGNRMDPRFKEAIVQVTNDPCWMMTGAKRRAFNARMHLVRIPPNLAPCIPSRELWDPYVDGPLAPLHRGVAMPMDD